MNEERFVTFKSLLFEDHRRDNGKGGLTMKQAMPELGLKKGDKFEPSQHCLDWATFMDAEEPPQHPLVFWRPSYITSTKHRCILYKLFNGGFHDVVALDVLHTWCLGTFAQFSVHALWQILDKSKLTELGTKSKVDRHIANMLEVNKLIAQFHGELRKAKGEKFTRVPFLTVEKLGCQEQPLLHLKAAQTLTLLRFLNAYMPDCVDMPNQSLWIEAGAALLQIWDLFGDAPMVVPAHVMEELGVSN
eukprot:6465055-Amphidinium_carterae.2